MAITVKPAPVTIDEFDELLLEAPDRLLELIDGEVVEKMPTETHGEIQGLFVSVLRDFVYPRKLGRVGVEIRHKMPQEQRNSRLPDISFIAGIRPRQDVGSIPQMPDLAVEIKSPDDNLKELRDKAHYYLLNGTRMVLILDYTKKIVEVLTLDDAQILLEGDILDGGNVLPGFSYPVAKIFADPLLDSDDDSEE